MFLVIQLSIEYLDLLTYSLFIHTFKPRQNWPEWYSLIDERELTRTANRQRTQNTAWNLEASIKNHHVSDLQQITEKENIGPYVLK